MSALFPCLLLATQKPVTSDFIVHRADAIYPARWMAWTKDHDLLLADPTGITDLDAATGQTRHLGNTASLKAAGGPSLKKLGPPDAVDPSGKHLGYSFDQGFFVLDTATNQFHRLPLPKGAEEVHFSPDGESVSFVKDHDLYVCSSTGEPKRLTTTGKPDLLNGQMTWVYWEEIYSHDSNAAWWSPDSRQLAYFETDESPVPRTSYVDYRPQYPTTTTQCYPKPGHPNPIVRLKVVNPETGETQTVPTVQNQEYIVGVKWGEAGKLLFCTFNRAQTEARYNLFEPDTQKLTTLVVDPGKWLEVNTDFDLVDGGHSLLFASSRTGTDHYYKVPITGGAVTPITKGDWTVESNVEGPTAMQNLDKKNGRLLFTCTKDSFLERQVYAVNTDGSGLRRVTQGRGYHYVLASPDGQYFTDEWSNLNKVPETKLWSVSGKPLRTIDAPHPEVLNEIYHNWPKPITIKARDGYPLPALLRMPRKMTPGKRYPVILHVYGGPESPMIMDRWSFFWADDQLLSDNGYIVLAVDCRTATIKSKRLQAANRGHFYGAQERNDFVDAARWIKRQPYADPNRVGIWGYSGGGGNTVNCMVHTTEFKAGIAGAPYIDPAYYDTFYSEHLFGLPKDNPTGYKESAAWRYAQNLHGKLLLVWGSSDDNVQQQHELAFVDACVKAGKPVQVMIYPNRKHGIGDPAAFKHFTQLSLEFWKANL